MTSTFKLPRLKSVPTKRAHRVDWGGRITKTAVRLGGQGFHAETIARATGLTVNQVRYRLNKQGCALRDYRNGEGVAAKRILTAAIIRSSVS